MSMQRLPGPDGIHWPLVLNIPGEGFGDDVLQKWSSHRLLTESDKDAFLLDQVWSVCTYALFQYCSHD